MTQSQVTPADIAESVVGDNYSPGDDGYHDPKAVNWGYTDVAVSRFHGLMPGGQAGWLEWFEAECRMDEREELGANWRELLSCDVDRLADAVVLKKSGCLYLWDGWHRIGAAIVREIEELPAIVGFPIKLT